MIRPRLEGKQTSDISAKLIDSVQSPPYGVSINGKGGDQLQIDLRDAKRLRDFLTKALAYFDAKVLPKRKAARK